MSYYLIITKWEIIRKDEINILRVKHGYQLMIRLKDIEFQKELVYYLTPHVYYMTFGFALASANFFGLTLLVH